jgi:ribonuclease HIII
MSANVSNVKVDGEVVPGLQAIEYKIVRNKQNVHNIGTDERVGVDYGPMVVTGTLVVRSTYPKLDTLLIKAVADVKGFQIVVELKKLGQSIKTLTFDECYLDGKSFSLDANGVAVSNYDFTSTRLREQ